MKLLSYIRCCTLMMIMMMMMMTTTIITLGLSAGITISTSKGLPTKHKFTFCSQRFDFQLPDFVRTSLREKKDYLQNQDKCDIHVMKPIHIKLNSIFFISVVVVVVVVVYFQTTYNTMKKYTHELYNEKVCSLWQFARARGCKLCSRLSGRQQQVSKSNYISY